MIIKINTGYGKANGDSNWKYIDAVHDLECDRIIRSEAIEKYGYETNESTQLSSIWYEQYGTCSQDSNMLIMNYENILGGYNAIITNCPVYILNDNGKTIERIN